MVKTDEVLRTLLEMGFGSVSLNEAMFRGSGGTVNIFAQIQPAVSTTAP